MINIVRRLFKQKIDNKKFTEKKEINKNNFSNTKKDIIKII